MAFGSYLCRDELQAEQHASYALPGLSWWIASADFLIE